MTNEQRLQIRAELAQRMGYSQRHTTHLLAAELAGDWLKPDGSFFDDAPPDPFTNAADKDALVEWLAADIDRYSAFDAELRIELHRRGLITDAPALTAVELRRKMLTAPLETITLAAARALGIQEAE